MPFSSYLLKMEGSLKDQAIFFPLPSNLKDNRPTLLSSTLILQFFIYNFIKYIKINILLIFKYTRRKKEFKHFKANNKKKFTNIYIYIYN